MLVGCALVPWLPFQLQPSRTLPSLTVSFTWPDASAELIERHVSSKLEALMATLRGLENITSTTRKGQGSIRLSFDKTIKLDYLHVEVSTLIRQAMPDLPDQLSYPQIQRNRPREEADPTLMTFTLTGPASPYAIQTYAEEQLQPRLSLVPGIHRIELYGASPFAWELTYDQDQFQRLGLREEDIQQALERWLFQEEIGNGTNAHLNQGQGQQVGVPDGFRATRYVLEGKSDALDWESVPIKRLGNRMLYLTDVLDIRRQERPAQSYHRINGLNTINLIVTAQGSANQLEVADALKAEVEALRVSLPPGYSLIEVYDATEFLRAELSKIAWRSLFSVVILLGFVWVVSRSLTYLGVILFSLAANLAISCLCYYLFALEIHLYSLAGITVSLGLIIDNSIVMIDHLRRERNLSVFLAILAATLTTVGALVVIMFLEENQRLLLQDFAWVMMINLGVSLAVALWLIPALVSPEGTPGHPKKQPLHSQHASGKGSSLKRLNLYRLFFKLRPLFIIAGILAFGLPVFLLPKEWETEAQQAYYGPKEDMPMAPWYMQWYNETLGSKAYQQDIKPWADQLLGGTLRLFMEETYPNARYQEPERTALHIRGEMPPGTTIHQMNDVMEGLENFLAQYQEIEQFQTDIRSSQSAYTVIYFKSKYDKSAFPYLLKSRVERFSVDQGAVDWRIYGVGKGFNNSIGMGGKNSRITLRGYHYDQLLRYAGRIKDSLLVNPRIKEVFLNGERRWDYRPNFDYVLSLDKRRLLEQGTTPEAVFDYLQQLSLHERPLMYTRTGNRYEQIILKPRQAKAFDVWDVKHQPLQSGDSTTFKLREAADMIKVQAEDIIYRENQQYRLLVEYDFVGPNALRRRVQERMTDQANAWLPLGYTAETGGEWWRREAERKQYGLILLVIAIIYGICAILLESLWQPLAIIAMIPLSFIGLFLTFYAFEFNFDQGGYAAFLVLSGLSVNAALYIVHEYNRLKKQAQAQRGMPGFSPGGRSKAVPSASNFELYLQAFRRKIIPIGLTVLSTVLGLIPFVWAGQDEPFWFALAVGTIGGLLFSVLAIVVYLPLLIVRRVDHAQNEA